MTALSFIMMNLNDLFVTQPDSLCYNNIMACVSLVSKCTSINMTWKIHIGCITTIQYGCSWK